MLQWGIFYGAKFAPPKFAELNAVLGSHLNSGTKLKVLHHVSYKGDRGSIRIVSNLRDGFIKHN